jgi:DNA repair exonuclease SbcCD ATPase subunit
MRITLKNFRCYENKIFDLGNNGLSLISGHSGAGKSTIIMGIYFCLFGEGKKVTSFGKTSCSVEIEMEHENKQMNIIRTKRPNRLVLVDDGIEYEDQSAQSIINQKFGETFNVSGYIAQNAFNSFVLMNPLEKLEFLEKFAFKDVDLTDIKSRCRTLINERKEIHLSTIAQLDLATRFLNEMEKPVEVSFPIKCKKSSREKFIKNEEIKLKNCNVLIKKTTKCINSLKDELNDIKILRAILSEKEDFLSIIYKKIKVLQEEKDNIEYEGDETLNSYKEYLKFLLARKELDLSRKTLSKDIEKLEEMKRQEFEEYEIENKTIAETLWSEISKNEVTENIENLKITMSDMKKISELRNEIKKLKVISNEDIVLNENLLVQHRNNVDDKKKLVDKLSSFREIYSCPSCNSHLKFRDNTLVAHDIQDVDVEELKTIEVKISQTQAEVKNLQKEIRRLEGLIPQQKNDLDKINKLKEDLFEVENQYEEIPDIDECVQDLEYFENYLLSQNKLESRKSVLDKGVKYSSACSTFERNIDKQKVSIKSIEETLKDNPQDEYSEEEIREMIDEQQRYKDKLRSISSQIHNLEKDKVKCLSQIEDTKRNHDEKHETVRDEEEINELISQKENEFSEYENKLRACETVIKQIEEFRKYEQEMVKYETFKRKVAELEHAEKREREIYAASMLLREKILEAESSAMINVIESINSHAQIYLDLFFPDGIVVKLSAFKETKKATKPCINMEVEYKGMECDLSMLSGGELARVILAFCLSLAEIFNTPLILLDECTASLDQDLTSIVFEGIKANCPNKLIVIIAHQIIEGSFDRRIAVGTEYIE